MIFRIFVLTALITLTGCNRHDFFPDKAYGRRVADDLNSRRSIIGPRWDELSATIENVNDFRVSASLNFLYAYMPLNDLADLPVSFFAGNAEMSVTAIDEMPWGKSISAELFLNFVLPPRVNNENLDSFRILFYKEIKNRISGLDIKDAALEINRWCHEKVTYQSADIRTSSPLSTVLSARGRCGEESTFTVAALRTAGIPARQVYTPRWAHSDDNHAWVEVWIDGQWYYMGACEPEPVLDRGWFTEPARRAMLIHTKAFGLYDGDEKVLRKEGRYSEINNLEKYAVTKEIVVAVCDSVGVPLPEMEVEYQLYNYAEFYPIAKIKTDINGMCSFHTGLGDLLIWSGYKNSFGFGFISVADVDTVKILMNQKPGNLPVIERDLFAPVAPQPGPGISSELIELNRKLIARGDSIRRAYINSWISEEEIVSYCNRMEYDAETVTDIIRRSQGNFREIMAFLSKNADRKELAVHLLNKISEKDLRDTKEYILTDHLVNSAGFIEAVPDSDKQLYINYVLNPRVAEEMLTAWRQNLPEEAGVEADFDRTDSIQLESLVNLINEKIKINDAENYYGTPLTPQGVLYLGLSDSRSRKILATALFRSLGVPARLEPGTDRPQYYFNGNWIDVWFADEVAPSDERSAISLKYDGSMPEPEYYIHFTLARYENGRYTTLAFDYNRRVTDFDDTLAIYPGNYLLVTGNRISDSRILARLNFFTIAPGEHQMIDVTPRHESLPPDNLGKMSDEEISLLDSAVNGVVSGDFSSKGFIIAWVDAEAEPSKHLLNDLPRMKQQFEKWEGKIIILVSEQTEPNNALLNSGTLPSNTIVAIDSAFSTRAGLALVRKENRLPELPYVLLVDSNKVITYISEGYKIGIAEQLIKRIGN